jgi:phosphoribosylformylglycinamidine synthase
MDAKRPGDWVYVLGVTRPELGGSEYWAAKGFVGNSVPRVRLEESLILYRSMERAIGDGLVASCHDCSDGGLAVALAETAFAGGLGLNVDLSLAPAERVTRDDELLFSESQSRFVVTVHPESAGAFDALVRDRPACRVGEVTAEPYLRVQGRDGREVMRASLAELKEAWQSPLAGI